MKIPHPVKAFKFSLLAITALGLVPASFAESLPLNPDCGALCESVYSMAELDQTPKPTRQPAPVYPAELRAAGISGEALISFVVDKWGQIRDVHAVRETSPRFSEAAIAAVQQWHFDPAVKDGQVVSCRLQVPIVFSLAN